MLTSWRIDLTQVVMRPISQADAAVVARGFDLLGRRSRYRRWGNERVTARHALAWLRELDGDRHFAIGACSALDHQPLGVARYVRDEPGAAEIAVTVIDAAQGQGLGRLLLDRLVEHASHNGIHTLRAHIRTDNRAAVRLMRAIGGRACGPPSGGLIQFEASLKSNFREPASASAGRPRA